MSSHSHALWLPGLLLAVLTVAQSPAADKSNATTAPPPSHVPKAAGELPKDYDGYYIAFPGDNVPGVGPDENVIHVDDVFSDERIARTLQFVDALYGAHNRLQNAFYQNSNLRSLAPSGNPYTLQSAPDIAQLPDNTVIEWKLTPKELADLDLPAWDQLVLGGGNANAFLAAARQYSRYKIADLELALMACTQDIDPERRTALETQHAEAKQAVIKYLQTPPAD